MCSYRSPLCSGVNPVLPVHLHGTNPNPLQYLHVNLSNTLPYVLSIPLIHLPAVHLTAPLPSHILHFGSDLRSLSRLGWEPGSFLPPKPKRCSLVWEKQEGSFRWCNASLSRPPLVVWVTWSLSPLCFCVVTVCKRVKVKAVIVASTKSSWSNAAVQKSISFSHSHTRLFYPSRTWYDIFPLIKWILGLAPFNQDATDGDPHLVNDRVWQEMKWSDMTDEAGRK